MKLRLKGSNSLAALALPPRCWRGRRPRSARRQRLKPRRQENEKTVKPLKDKEDPLKIGKRNIKTAASIFTRLRRR